MSAALLRLQIERSLEHRFPAALSPVPRALETTPTGIREVDDLLDGGLPTGAITEITGVQSSGRTSLALAFVARQTGEGRSCAWIDADDALDPESAAASGVVLRQLLWVRCQGAEEIGRASSGFDGRHPSGAKARSSIDRHCGTTEQAAEKKSNNKRKWHPKQPSGAKAQPILLGLTRGLKPSPPSEQSFSAACEVVPLLQDLRVSGFSAARKARADSAPVMYGLKPVPSSGAKARVQFAAFSAGINPCPSKTASFSAAGEAHPQCIGSGPEGTTDSDLFMARLKSCPSYKTSMNSRFSAGEAMSRKKPWARLEQAIRATDLLLQAGGFAAIVLDLAGTAPEHASRIPLATWFRFRQAAARTRCSLVVLGQAACAQSSAAAVLKCAPFAARDKGNTVLDGFTFSLHRSRGDAGFRSAGGPGRKPPESAWPADCAWNAEKRA